MPGIQRLRRRSPGIGRDQRRETWRHITGSDSPWRTFQDRCRAAQVHDFVARSISGHATVEMQQLYSSVSALEVRDVRDGLAKVVSLMGFRRTKEERAEGNPTESGDGSGYREEVALDRG